MLGTIVSFCLMAVVVRELNREVPVQQIIVFRNLIGLLVTTVLITSLGRFHLFQTRRIGTQILRNGFHFFGQFGWLFGIGYLSLADVFAIEFTVPVWVAIIAAVFLKERLTKLRIISVLMGVTGVIVIVNPTMGLIDPAAWLMLGSALCYAVAHTANKSLTNTDTALGMLFYMSLIQFPIGLALSYPVWVWPEGMQWMYISVVGLTALTGHFCMNRAMQLAEVGYVMTIDFLRLPVIALLGVLLYNEAINLALIVGGVIILAANLVNWRDQSRRYT